MIPIYWNLILFFLLFNLGVIIISFVFLYFFSKSGLCFFCCLTTSSCKNITKFLYNLAFFRRNHFTFPHFFACFIWRKTGKTPKKIRENTEEKPEKHRRKSGKTPKYFCVLCEEIVFFYAKFMNESCLFSLCGLETLICPTLRCEPKFLLVILYIFLSIFLSINLSIFLSRFNIFFHPY